MAVAYDNSSSAQNFSVTSLTVAGYAIGVGAIAAVELATTAAPGATTITVGGVAAVAVAGASGNDGTWFRTLYKCLTPPSGSQSIVANWTNVTSGVLTIITATGAQDVVNGNYAQAASATVPISITSNAGDLTFSFTGDGDTGSTHTTSQTLRIAGQLAGGDTGPGTAGPITHTWTNTGSFSGNATGANFQQIAVAGITPRSIVPPNWTIQRDWKPQRWDFPLTADLLFDDFLPSAGGGVQSFSYTATGGLTFGGVSTVVRGQLRTAAGGLTFGGASTAQRGITRAASGGLTFGGAATALRGKAVTASGGLTFGGVATVVRSMLRSASGGLSFGGAANVVRSMLRSASGGLTFGGAATALRARVIAAAGGLTFAGTAALLRGIVRVASGGLIFSGTSPNVKQKFVNTSGGITFGGSAPETGTNVGGGGSTPDERTRHWMLRVLFPGGR